MKRLAALMLIVLFLLSGCSSESEADTTEKEWIEFAPKSMYEKNIENGIEMDDFSDNLDISYLKWSYEGTQFNDEERLAWWDDNNLTDTCTDSDNGLMKGYCVIDSLSSYQELMSRIENKIEYVKGYIGHYEHFDISVDTLNQELDEAFFEEYNLAVVDYSNEGSVMLRSRLEEVDVGFFSHTATIKISKEELYATTAAQPGEVYFIPIPKRCSDLEVIYLETAWNRPY